MSGDFSLAKMPPYNILDEPFLSFDASDSSKRDQHPLRGIIRFGPYTNSIFAAYTPRVRVALVGPRSGMSSIERLISDVAAAHSPGDRKEYVPPFPGFERAFGVPLEIADRETRIEWPDQEPWAGTGERPEDAVRRLAGAALQRLSLVRDRFEVAVVYFPDRWMRGLRTETTDAHDELKGAAALLAIPTQILNDRSFVFRYKASIAWRLAIAFYVKAGGVPWKLSPLPGASDRCASIGLAYSLRLGPGGAHFITCCSQVFDADGGGMQFVAFEARDPVTSIDDVRRNPFLGREDMRAVLARSLRIYQARNAGTLPRRLVVHKTTPFKSSEVEGAFDALAAVPEVELLEVRSNSAWRGVWLARSTRPGSRSEATKYPIPRGSMMHTSGHSVLLWIAGNAPSVSATRDFYQGKRGIPRPISLVRHSGKGPLEVSAQEVLALTKMDWNNDALYDPVPVTIKYSQRLARTIAFVPELPGNTYPYRLFM